MPDPRRGACVRTSAAIRLSRLRASILGNLARGSVQLRLGLGAVAVLCAPFAVRIALIADSDFGSLALDLRGFAADAASGLVALAIAIALSRISRWLALAWVALWSIIHYANFETVSELGSIASVLDAHFLASPTFLLGSAAAVSSPVLLAAAVAVPLGLGFAAFRELSWRSALACAALGGLALAGLGAWPRDDASPPWRQVEVFGENSGYLLRTALKTAEPGPRFPDPPTAMLDLLPELRADLDGESILPAEGRARNVILVVLEAFSGAFVEPLARANGYADLLQLPRLGAMLDDGVAFSSFVSQQRKTSRGMYALLCGEPPNLIPATPKMTEHVHRAWRECLPAVLAAAGYQTVYQQAAPLPFMLKDQFMPKAGFQRVYGHDVFDTAYLRSHWGVDDLAFFEQTVDRVQELHDEGRPFFLTTLTVGTHHPLLVPPTWEPARTGKRRKALRYADHAVGVFIDTLRERGLLEDTLVLITSDESRGLMTRSPLIKRRLHGITKQLTQNWGLLIALNSGASPRIVSELFSQMDVAISVLDYLELADRGRHFFGRSVFRRYAEPRWLFFANSNFVKASAFDPRGHLLMCNVLIDDCRKWTLDAPGPFGNARTRVDWDPETDSVLPELAARSVRPAVATERRDYQLVGGEVVELDRQAYTAREVVHGGQHIDLRPDQWLEVEIDVTAHDLSGNGGAVKLLHYIRNSRTWSLERFGVKSTTLLIEEPHLRDGETFRLLYTIANQRTLQGVKCQSYAQTTKPGEWELHFRTARMSVRSGPGRPQDGVHTIRSEIIAAKLNQEEPR